LIQWNLTNAFCFVDHCHEIEPNQPTESLLLTSTVPVHYPRQGPVVSTETERDLISAPPEAPNLTGTPEGIVSTETEKHLIPASPEAPSLTAKRAGIASTEAERNLIPAPPEAPSLTATRAGIPITHKYFYESKVCRIL
jgi:hypothetical protein